MIQDTLLATPQDSLYRWLDQHGEAFGAPGMEPLWTSSVKDAVGTAYSASSRIWFTVSHGILNEIYHPTIDHPQTRDMELLVTDGESFVHEEMVLLTSTELLAPFGHQTMRGWKGRQNSSPVQRARHTNRSVPKQDREELS